MQPPSTSVVFPLRRLQSSLERVRQAIGATRVMASDHSGNLLGAAPDNDERDAIPLAALAAGNFAAADEIFRLSRIRSPRDEPQSLIVERPQGCLVLCRGVHGIIFIAVLGTDGAMGLARLELRLLASFVWKDVEPVAIEPSELAAGLAQKFVDSLEADS